MSMPHSPDVTTLQEPPEQDGVAAVPVLYVVQSPDARRERQIALPPHQERVVGRSLNDAAGAIRDPRLSRTHFRLVWDPRSRTHRLADLGSANGTFVNGARVQSCALSAGDVVRAGTTLFVYAEPQSMAEVRARALAIAPSNVPVLIMGETGTGKELMARLLHQHSGRSGRFLAVNCASLTPELMASELFGHAKGAFSGALAAREGLFAAARGGTLLLDEIGAMPLDMQPTLLRVLQERTVRPVGSEREVTVDVRIVAATNAKLREEAGSGSFRGDLYARLAHVLLELPPLRQRRVDLLGLTQELARVEPGLEVTADAAEALLLWDWPYNVRELESLLEARATLPECRGPATLAILRRLKPELVEAFEGRRAERPSAPRESAAPGRPFSQRPLLEAALRRHGGNVSATARELGKPRAYVYRWMKRLGMARSR